MSDLADWDQEDEELEMSAPATPAGANEKAIERHFQTGRLRVVQDKNDFFLPHVLDFIEGRKWGNLRPEYQRRLRWDLPKKSKLIESFIMNVPVPPVFLFESENGSYEVMDGQQRLNTILEFLKGGFELEGLKIWPALNTRSFQKLPPLVRRGLERAKITAITLISDTSGDTDLDLRAQVFERLNTGGERLNPQELRNSLYSGRFNKMLVAMTRLPDFTRAWDIPSNEENTLSDGSPSQRLRENNLFKRMLDVEIVLRFFAFRNEDRISGSVRSMLDNTMKRNRNVEPSEIDQMARDFTVTLGSCLKVFGENAFRLPAGRGETIGKLSRPLYDAQMVAMYDLSADFNQINRARLQVREAISQIARPGSFSYDLIVGRANTASSIRGRIQAVRAAIERAL